jgi:aminobenzoyl-glutamate transport protein
MLPYSVVFFLGWAVMFSVWVVLSLPMGPGAPLHYTP